MLFGNLLIWAILLVLLTFWGPESLQAAAPPSMGEQTGKRGPQQVPLKVFQSLLLRRLGLQQHPEPKPGQLVPQYLLDLYQFCLGRAPTSLKETELPFLEEQATKANTVRTFHHAEDLVFISEGVGSSFYVLFNLTLLPLEEELTALELRLYHSQKESQRLNINIYHATDPTPAAINKSSLLACKFVTLNQPQWVSFDVTDAFKEAGEKQSLGFLVELEPSSGSRVRLHQQASLRVRRSPGEEEAQWALERPLLVTYSHDKRGRPLAHGKRQSRSQPISLRDRQTTNIPHTAKRRKSQKPKTKASSRCRRHRLFVDFKAVGWNDWIIAPSGYHAFYCSGVCRFPLADHMNSTSHSVVQTMLNSVNSKVPKTCCVPTELSPIALLYLDQHEMVVLKTYQDMVVEGCGCR